VSVCTQTAAAQPHAPHSPLPTRRHGNPKTMNMEGVLATTIVSSKVFRFDVLPLESVEDVIADIPAYTTHVEPWEAGVTPRTASPAFLYVFRLACMRLTRGQLRTLLRHVNPFVRAVALLWVRYTLPPPSQWDWFEPLLADTTSFQASSPPVGALGSASAGRPVSFGSWARGLLGSELHYFGTLLPRTPVLIGREWEAALPAYEADERRAAECLRRRTEVVAGCVVRARWEASPGVPLDRATWLSATVTRLGEGKGRAGLWGALVWLQPAGADGHAELPLEFQDIELPRAVPAPQAVGAGAGVGQGWRAGGGGGYRGPDRPREGREYERPRDSGYERPRDRRSPSRDRSWDRRRDGSPGQGGRGREKDRRGGDSRDRSPPRRSDRSRSRDRDRRRYSRSRSRERAAPAAVDAYDYDSLLARGVGAGGGGGSKPVERAQGGGGEAPAALLARYGSGEARSSAPAVGGRGYKHERDVEGAEDVIRHARR
jgi:hypothetical protein